MFDIQSAQPGTADFDFQLRAKRDGGGEGRTYLVTYRATSLRARRPWQRP